jgi:hypothetical protein
MVFRGRIPTARAPARLRFADVVASAVARLASDPPGSALIGRDSHPLDDSSEFQEVTASFYPNGPTELGRTKTLHMIPEKEGRFSSGG